MTTATWPPVSTLSVTTVTSVTMVSVPVFVQAVVSAAQTVSVVTALS